MDSSSTQRGSSSGAAGGVGPRGQHGRRLGVVVVAASRRLRATAPHTATTVWNGGWRPVHPHVDQGGGAS